jgi:N-acetyl-anhydromuramyl-L-alanine amidase AmpD
MKIKNHLLSGDNIVFSETPNTSGKFKSGLPDTLVMHYTGGSSAESSVRHLTKKSSKASAHLVIGRAGEIFQLAPFNIVTWHAGRSSWDGRNGLNRFSIGIELDNAGELEDNGNGKFISWFNRAYDADDVYFGRHRNRASSSFWHAYTEEQLERTFDLCELLYKKYDIKAILGHEEIAPARKSDPGPAFPLARIREQILTDNRSSDLAAENSLEVSEQSIVNVTKLNIRQGPGVQYGMAGEALKNGSIVKTLNTNDGWTEVEYTVKGWVSSQYIRPVV